MTQQTSFSPVSISYAAALRGVKPRRPGAPFVYIDIDCSDADYAVCMAASNPEGTFYAITRDKIEHITAQSLAQSRHVTNITFLSDTLTSLPLANYVCFNQSGKKMNTSELNSLFDMATRLLLPNGLFAYQYQSYEDDGEALRFLVREYAPEMNAAQAATFLRELKLMGGFYFANRKDLAAKLDQAIAKNMPDEFFVSLDTGDVHSSTFNNFVSLGQRGLAYAGDLDVAVNYVELSVPSEAQDLVIDCRDKPLYEIIKDFALNRQTRTDIWCKQPASQSSNLAELFGNFAYGISMERNQIPREYKAQGKIIDLQSTLYTSLMDLMALMPITVGDFLSHPSGQDLVPSDVVRAVQILVACGIARPMRGLAQGENAASVAQPRLVGSFNQYFGHTPVNSAEINLASTIIGAPVTLSARDVLVMQALDRAGLANSASALMPELERLTSNPALASRIMDATAPTPEMAKDMIKDVVGRSIVQWYAYGLLKAA